MITQTRGEKFQKSAKCKNDHFNPMSNQAWCDLSSKGHLPFTEFNMIFVISLKVNVRNTLLLLGDSSHLKELVLKILRKKYKRD